LTLGRGFKADRFQPVHPLIAYHKSDPGKSESGCLKLL
jgi:hypothetical protein